MSFSLRSPSSGSMRSRGLAVVAFHLGVALYVGGGGMKDVARPGRCPLLYGLEAQDGRCAPEGCQKGHGMGPHHA